MQAHLGTPRALWPVLAITLLLAGCPPDAVEPASDASHGGQPGDAASDAAVSADRVTPADANAVDGAARDAAAPDHSGADNDPDAATADDATGQDVAVATDAETQDLAAPDGQGLDAAANDAGAGGSDAATEVDAAQPDAACPAGYERTSSGCVDIDGCAGQPCFAELACHDVPAPGEGFTCDPCPPGWSGNGVECLHTCGDGVLDPGEACDDGDDLDSGTCNATCQGVGLDYGSCVDHPYPYKQIDAASQLCAIGPTDELQCWGYPASLLPIPNGTFTQVSGGTQFVCALRSDDTITCWGDSQQNRLKSPLGRFKAISAGSYHACALRLDDTVVCWGATSAYQGLVPLATVRQLDCGGYHCCAVMMDDAVQCWGADGSGESTPPTGGFREVSAGPTHSCGIRLDGSVACWGDNSWGQRDAPSGTYQHVSAGERTSCGIDLAGALSCWGWDDNGRALPPAGSFTQVTSGPMYGCARSVAGELACWGNIGIGETGPIAQISVGSRSRTCSIRVDGTLSCLGLEPPAGTFVQVRTGPYHACALDSAGHATCWGSNTDGEATAPAELFKEVAVGASHSCGILLDDTVDCWGRDSDGQATPVSGTFLHVSGGDAHSCGVRLDGRLACWGNNGGNRATPPPGTYLEVGSGAVHGCALASDGTVACWGSNTNGQTTPPSGTFAHLAVGRYHNCGLRADHKLECWGSATSDNFGPPDLDFKQVSAGDFYTCGVDFTCRHQCWGGFIDQDLSGRVSAVCGSGILEPGEQCDDGNTVDEVSCAGGGSSCTICSADCRLLDMCPGGTTPYAGGACDTGNLGVCAAGVERCVSDTLQCVAEHSSGAEVCDGLDNNCDGVPDEDWTCDPCFRNIDVCDPVVGVCDASGTGYTCACPSGYTDVNADGTLCEDLDECLGEGGGNDCSTGCTNKPGYHQCGGEVLSCSRSGGGTYTSGGQITDCFVDYSCGEPRPREVWCDALGGGSFSCACKIDYITQSTLQLASPCAALSADNVNAWCGWDMRSPTRTVDDCRAGRLRCHATANCVDGYSSSWCACPPGFRGTPGLYSDGCVDIDECATSNGGCGNPAYITCVNQIGAPPLCQDIDECAVNNGGCGDPTWWKCDNQVAAPQLCSDRDECASSNGGCGDAEHWVCSNNEAAPPTCSDRDECATDNGGCGPKPLWACTNNEGADPTCSEVDCLTTPLVFDQVGLLPWVVPDGVSSLSVQVSGAGGGAFYTYNPGGRGGHVEASVPVSVGSTLYVVSGGGGFGNCPSWWAAGGGGFSGVLDEAYAPLATAGGGGGGALNAAGCAVGAGCAGAHTSSGDGWGGGGFNGGNYEGHDGSGAPTFLGGARGGSETMSDPTCSYGGFGGGGGGAETWMTNYPQTEGGGGGGGGFPGGGGGWQEIPGRGGTNTVGAGVTLILSNGLGGLGGEAGTRAGLPDGEGGRVVILCQP